MYCRLSGGDYFALLHEAPSACSPPPNGVHPQTVRQHRHPGSRRTQSARSPWSNTLFVQHQWFPCRYHLQVVLFSQRQPPHQRRSAVQKSKGCRGILHHFIWKLNRQRVGLGMAAPAAAVRCRRSRASAAPADSDLWPNLGSFLQVDAIFMYTRTVGDSRGPD